MFTRLAGGENTGSISSGSPGEIEIANPYDGDVVVTHLALVYPDSNYDKSLVSEIRETSTQFVALSGSIQYKALGERAGAGQFGKRMIPLEFPLRWPKGGRIKVTVQARTNHAAQDLSFLFYCQDPRQQALSNPVQR